MAVELWAAGRTAAEICRSLSCSRSWFYKWLRRHQGGQAQWFEPQSRRPQAPARQLGEEVVEVVKLTRLSLYNQGVFCGAQAIRWELEDSAFDPLPSVRTINRILAREELTHRRTGRYEPKGRAYPSWTTTVPNHVHQADFVGPCFLRGPVRFYSYNSVDLATGRCALEPLFNRGGQAVIDAIWAVWGRLGLPAHHQVDNDMAFFGSPAHPRGLGQMIRLCLAHEVEPWFIPPREPWRNGVVEKFNDQYQQRFLRRQDLTDYTALREHSLRFEQRHNQAYRYSKLGGRTPAQSLQAATTVLRWPATPAAPRLPLGKPRQGRYHLVRYIRTDRCLDIFGEKFELPVETTSTYVVATVLVAEEKLQIRIGQELVDQIDYRLF